MEKIYFSTENYWNLHCAVTCCVMKVICENNNIILVRFEIKILNKYLFQGTSHFSIIIRNNKELPF